MRKRFVMLMVMTLLFSFFNFAAVNVQAAESDGYKLKATIRDFDPVNDERQELYHPDFENPEYFDTSTKGAVKSNLGSDNKPVYSKSGYTTKIITNEESFYDWYHDTPKNINISYDMVFKKIGKKYIFDSALTNGFFPINDQGFGNYYDGKNYHFTLELHTKFVYKAGQSFSISGDDDVWLFINKKLVGDLGGIHETQSVDIRLDDYSKSLDLVSGETYSLDLFFAERHVTESNLKIETNIVLSNNHAPKAHAGDDQNLETDGNQASVILDGTKSKDSDGDELTYIWKNEAGKKIATGVNPRVNFDIGKHKITLTVSDGELADTDTVIINVKKKQVIQTNKPTAKNTPTATAKPTSTPKVTATTKPTSTAKITATTKPTSTAKITATTKPTSTAKITATTKPTSTPKVTTTTKPTSTPKVTATTRPTSTPKVTATTKPTSTPTIKPTPTLTPNLNNTDKSDGISSGSNKNNAPIANAGKDQIVLTNDEVADIKLDGSKSSDKDGDSLTYKWKNESNVTIGNGATPNVKLPLGNHKITLNVSDGKLSSTDTVIIKVEKQDMPPSSVMSMDVAVSLLSDERKVAEDKEVIFTIRYANKTQLEVQDVYIEMKLLDVQVVNNMGGVRSGNKMRWEVGKLKAYEKGEITFTIKPGFTDKAEIIKEFVANIFSRSSRLSNTYDDSSKLDIMVYSNRFLHTHSRYISGYPDNTFKGERNITRAEIAAIFATILNLKDVDITIAKQFVDVKEGFWAEHHIYAVVQAGLFKGVDTTHFYPDTPIKRAELATVIANYLGISRTSEQKPFESSFNDVTNHWAHGNIEEITRYKIAKGYDDGAFRPQKNVARQEAVVMINRLLYRGPLTNVSNSFPDMTSGHWAFGDIEEAVRTHNFTIDENGAEVMK